MISVGQYLGRAIRGKVQVGESDSGTLQMTIDMNLRAKDNPEPLGAMTTALFFSDKSYTYSFERLRLLGWKGTTIEDIKNLDDIFENEVPCTVEAPVPYKDASGETKMGFPRLTIDSGAGTFTMNKQMTLDTFAARLAAVTGGAAPAGGSTPAGNGGNSGAGKPPPF